MSPLMVFGLLGLAAHGHAAPPEARALVDRVVALVGQRPILLSEVRGRAALYLAALDEDHGTSGPEREAAERALERQVLERMIDEEILASEASKGALEVTPAEIDAALEAVARHRGTTVAEYLEAVRGVGLREEAYRAEVARQLLQRKVVELRVRPRVALLASMSDEERAASLGRELRAWLAEARAERHVEVRL